MPTRYPDEGYKIEYSKVDAKECLQMAQEITKFIRNFLNVIVGWGNQ